MRSLGKMKFFVLFCFCWGESGIIFIDQIGRDAEIFRLLPKVDSFPPISSTGVLFHTLNRW